MGRFEFGSFRDGSFCICITNWSIGQNLIKATYNMIGKITYEGRTNRTCNSYGCHIVGGKAASAGTWLKHICL